MSTITPENTPNTTDGMTNDSTSTDVNIAPSVRLVTSTSRVKRIAFCADCEMSWASQRSRKLRFIRTGRVLDGWRRIHDPELRRHQPALTGCGAAMFRAA